MKFKILLTLAVSFTFATEIIKADYYYPQRRRVVRRYYRDYDDGGRVGRGIVGGAATGALFGGIFGGGRGAAIGAGVGAGLGGISAARRHGGRYVEEVQEVEPEYVEEQPEEPVDTRVEQLQFRSEPRTA